MYIRAFALSLLYSSSPVCVYRFTLGKTTSRSFVVEDAAPYMYIFMYGCMFIYFCIYLFIYIYVILFFSYSPSPVCLYRFTLGKTTSRLSVFAVLKTPRASCSSHTTTISSPMPEGASPSAIPEGGNQTAIPEGASPTAIPVGATPIPEGGQCPIQEGGQRPIPKGGMLIPEVWRPPERTLISSPMPEGGSPSTIPEG